MSKYVTKYKEAKAEWMRLDDKRLNAFDGLRIAQKAYDDAKQAADLAQQRVLLIADMAITAEQVDNHNP